MKNAIRSTLTILIFFSKLSIINVGAVDVSITSPYAPRLDRGVQSFFLPRWIPRSSRGTSGFGNETSTAPKRAAISMKKYYML